MINRREFLAGASACAAAVSWTRGARAEARFDPRPGDWRSFAVTTRLEVAKGQGPVQAWAPLPSLAADDWIVPEEDAWTGNAELAEVVTDPRYGARLLHARFAAEEAAPTVEIVSRFRTRDRAVALDGPAAPASLGDDERALYLAATDLMPTDGIVKETADRITAGIDGDAAQARALYEWVVENTRRVAATRGCGTGDVASMLASGNLGGKCADLNALYVALARASGIPARDLYGIRVAPSRFGYKSLGAGSETITKSQHCRAEVFLADFGWVPVDPADVRKVVLEEPPGENPLDSEVVVAAREKLFGAWEGNWLAYNSAHDLVLPGSEHRVAFLMYPQAEVAGELLDCLDPDTFRYAITSAEMVA
jgi:transglutaminase-like putative cysteine protease